MTGAQREPKLSSLHLSDSGFLFDPYTGLTYGLNSTGRVIVDWLKQGVKPKDIPDRVAKEFDVPRQTAAADFEEFYEKLDKENLLWTR